MMISEESFPEDDLMNVATIGVDSDRDDNGFHMLTTGTIINTSSICERSSSSRTSGHEINSSSSITGQSSSDKFSDESKETTASDPSKPSKKHIVKSQKSLSYQDLHSNYTKKRYQHVTSKVRDYIVNIKAEDRRRVKKFGRHRSLPETFQGYSDELMRHSTGDLDNESESTAINQDEASPESVSKFIIEQEMMQLKTMNEYLQSNLQDKVAQVARLKRNAESTRIELMQMKEKEKRNQGLRRNYSPRRSLPTLVYRPPLGRMTAATQTDIIEEDTETDEIYFNVTSPTPHKDDATNFFESKTIATIQPLSLNFNMMDDLPTETICTQTKNLRRRSNSNSTTKPKASSSQNQSGITGEMSKNGSDSAIESETEMDKETENLLAFENVPTVKYFQIKDQKDQTSDAVSKKKKKLKSIKKKFIWFLRPCTNCSRMDDSKGEQYGYSQIPLSENMFDCRL